MITLQSLFAGIMSLWVSLVGVHTAPVVQTPTTKLETAIIATTTAVTQVTTTIKQTIKQNTGTITASTTITTKDALKVSTTMEIINGISVPPEPDSAINNSTLTGVDINGNGVRDDVERYIAKNFGTDKKKYAESFEFARKEWSVIIKGDQKSIDAFAKIVSCMKLTVKEAVPITYLNINTPKRSSSYANALAGIVLEGCEQ